MSALHLDAAERDLIRSLILAEPDLVLGDDMVMRALVGDTGSDGRVVDLRDRLVARLDARLNRLVHANRSVIAAAYENVAGTNQIHRSVLALVEPLDLAEFLRRLTREVPRIVGVEEARLCLEAEVIETQAALGLGGPLGARVLAMPPGTIDEYLSLDGAADPAPVILRPCGEEAALLFGPDTRVASEALMRLDIAGGRGLMAFGAHDPDRFGPDQGVDLLTFFAGAVERLLVHRLNDPDNEV